VHPENKYFRRFQTLLHRKKIGVKHSGNGFIFSGNQKKTSIRVPLHLLALYPDRLAAVVQSRLGMNKKVFARKCLLEKIDKKTAENFLNKYHLMNSTSSSYNYGLFLNEELLAVASFSKGRKMRRLSQEKRSFELIRFCCKDGITVTGGLTKLVKNFCREKKAGDVMTYVDKEFSEGKSFINAGFVTSGETEPNCYLVDKKTFEKIPLNENKHEFDKDVYNLYCNKGNLKLIYTPSE
jgi:hypothetical protein